MYLPAFGLGVGRRKSGNETLSVASAATTAVLRFSPAKQELIFFFPAKAFISHLLYVFYAWGVRERFDYVRYVVSQVLPGSGIGEMYCAVYFWFYGTCFTALIYFMLYICRRHGVGGD